jgi:hypothetical protein
VPSDILGQSIMSRKKRLKFEAKKREQAEYREQREFDRKFHNFFAAAGGLMGDWDRVWQRFQHHCGKRWQRWPWVISGVGLLILDWTLLGSLALIWGLYMVYNWWGTWDI